MYLYDCRTAAQSIQSGKEPTESERSVFDPTPKGMYAESVLFGGCIRLLVRILKKIRIR